MTAPISLSTKGPWFDFLRDIDNALSRAVAIHCIGGFVLAVVHGIPRPTGDIDYIETVPRDARAELESIAGQGSAMAKKHRLYLQSVGIADLPDEYESRLERLPLELRHLSLWILEPYDLVLSKLTRNSPKDRDDVKFLIRKLHLDFATFYARWEKEMTPWIANRERHELTIQLWKEYFSTPKVGPRSTASPG